MEVVSPVGAAELAAGGWDDDCDCVCRRRFPEMTSGARHEGSAFDERGELAQRHEPRRVVDAIGTVGPFAFATRSHDAVLLEHVDVVANGARTSSRYSKPAIDFLGLARPLR